LVWLAASGCSLKTTDGDSSQCPRGWSYTWWWQNVVLSRSNARSLKMLS